MYIFLAADYICIYFTLRSGDAGEWASTVDTARCARVPHDDILKRDNTGPHLHKR